MLKHAGKSCIGNKMGISLEDYIAGRTACEHCEATGNQVACVTELLSREDSCIFYNAIWKNGDPRDDNDIQYLQKFRGSQAPNEVLECPV
mgnify:CR=1 FL=1